MNIKLLLVNINDNSHFLQYVYDIHLRHLPCSVTTLSFLNESVFTNISLLLSVNMLWQMVILFPIICILRFWFICVIKCDRRCLSRFKPGPNVLILTAHPDDECMFFAPLIMKLFGKGYKVHILCCSSGKLY